MFFGMKASRRGGEQRHKRLHVTVVDSSQISNPREVNPLRRLSSDPVASVVRHSAVETPRIASRRPMDQFPNRSSARRTQKQLQTSNGNCTSDAARHLTNPHNLRFRIRPPFCTGAGARKETN